ncbi:hypothetical protein GALL_495110 [mine drainage metagenome]|uniref:Uncharacterized protein n=1 Tax=mine drainage metagenome TaxID=410659 RepID=A0A1J5PCD7_9ZZZZ
MCGKSFIGFDHVHICNAQAGFFQGQSRSRYRANTHVLGVDTGVGISDQSCQRFQATGLCCARFHQYHSSCGIVDTRGIAGSDCPVFFQEGRFEFGQVCQCAVGPIVFIGVKNHITLAALEDHRHDLTFEIAAFNGPLGAVMAFYRQSVLVSSGNAPFCGNVFSSNSHVDALKRIVQGTHHHVDHFCVAHAGTPTHVQAGIRCPAHGFSTPANGNVSVTQQDALAGTHNGLKPRAAQAIHVEGGCTLGTSALNGCHAGQVHVFRFRIDNVTKHHMTHLLTRHQGT